MRDPCNKETSKRILWSVFVVISDGLKGKGYGVFIGVSEVENGEKKFVALVINPRYFFEILQIVRFMSLIHDIPLI